MRYRLVCASIVAFAAPAHANSFGVSLHIPAYCELEAPPLAMSPGDSIVQGTVLESCNSTSGFEVSASYRPLDTNERAQIIYERRSTWLSREGVSAIAVRHGAKFGYRSVALQQMSLNKPLVVTLSITPI